MNLINKETALSICNYIDDDKKNEFINRLNNTKMEIYLNDELGEEDTIRKIRVQASDDKYIYVYFITLSVISYKSCILDEEFKYELPYIEDGLIKIGIPLNLAIKYKPDTGLDITVLSFIIHLNDNYIFKITVGSKECKINCGIDFISARDNVIQINEDLRDNVKINENIKLHVYKKS